MRSGVSSLARSVPHSYEKRFAEISQASTVRGVF